jgi:hypothetical protein
MGYGRTLSLRPTAYISLNTTGALPVTNRQATHRSPREGRCGQSEMDYARPRRFRSALPQGSNDRMIIKWTAYLRWCDNLPFWQSLKRHQLDIASKFQRTRKATLSQIWSVQTLNSYNIECPRLFIGKRNHEAYSGSPLIGFVEGMAQHSRLEEHLHIAMIDP